MVDTQKLKSLMILNHYTNSELANELGINPKTLANYIKRGVFRTDVVEEICIILKIRDVRSVFFVKEKNILKRDS